MKKLLKNLLPLLIIIFVSVGLCNISLLQSHFVLFVPWIFFCFLYGKREGIIAFLSSFFSLVFIDRIFALLMLIVLFGIVFIRNILRFNNKRMEFILGMYNLIIVLFCSLLEIFLVDGNNYFLPFFAGVISYWVMTYFCKLYFSVKGIESRRLDASVSSFLFIIIGCFVIGLSVKAWGIDISYICLLVLSFLSVGIGLEIGTVYTLAIFGILLLNIGISAELFIFLSSFLLFFFLRGVSKVTLIFTYLSGIFLIIYYFNLSYLISFDYCLFSFLVLFIPKSFVKYLSGFCYGSEVYVEKINNDNKKFNLEISNKIIKMEEVFSLVCEKINIKERLKKNDKRMLVEEIDVFKCLLENFSDEIKGNYNFEYDYMFEKEFYKYGVDLMRFDLKENVFKKKVIDIDVRCDKKEIYSFIVPLVSKIMKKRFDIVSIRYDELFGYYSLKLESKKNIGFSYGVSQRSFDKSCCGDSYLVYENNDIQAFIISDGMGVGKAAKEVSKLTLDLFKKFMDVGFGVKQTLKSLNNILKGKCGKDSYSTIDVFLYDKINNKFYFYKNGANDSYLFNDNKIVIKGSGLPLGIVDDFEFKLQEIKFGKGDYLVMLSDGVKEVTLLDMEKIKNRSLQKMSEEIVSKDDNLDDDRTVFVIKIC